MQYSVLSELYITKNIDCLIKDIEDTKKECEDDKQKIIDLLPEKDKDLVGIYSQALLNTIQFKNEKHITEALYLGFKIGMEIKEMLLKYEGILD